MMSSCVSVLCAVFISTCTLALPTPTAPQLKWQGLEMGALVHFNMMTYGGCSPDAATFHPANLDTDQWAESFTAMGVRLAIQ